MSQIDLQVGGRSYAITVQPGDEEHVHKLAGWINAKYQQLTPRYSQNLLFASLQLADDLHRAQQDWARAREEADQAINGNEDLKREANLAIGQSDKQKARIAELERELDQLQSSAQQEGNKYNDLVADNERFKVAVMEADGEKSRLEAELAELRRDYAALQEQLEAASQGSAPQSFIDPAIAPADPELAPSLERFAELLENCAEKLEGAGAAS